MYLLIRYPVGAIVEGVVLAHQKNRMRVAAAGFPDTIELRRSGDQWYTSTHEPVEFDLFIDVIATDVRPFLRRLASRDADFRVIPTMVTTKVVTKIPNRGFWPKPN